MKNPKRKSCLMLALSCVVLLSVPRKALAGDQNAGGPEERLMRIEQRVNQLADRQEEFMRRLSGPMGQPGPMGQQGQITPPGMVGQPGMTPLGPMPQPGSMGQAAPMPQPGMTGQPGMQPQPPGMQPQPGMMQPARRPGALAAKALEEIGGVVKLCLVACIVCNILLAVWIYTDIRKRGEGPGILIALALVAGVPAAIIYSLVRIGDKLSGPAKQV